MVACGVKFTSEEGGAAGGGAGAPGGGDAAASSSGGSTSQGGGPVTGDGFRVPIVINSADAVPTGYSLSVDIDHAGLVSAGKSLADGTDLWVMWDDGSGLVPIDRVLDPASEFQQPATRLWFSAQAPIAPGSSNAYYLYYGATAPGQDPPADAKRVYLVWDDFDAVDPAWTLSPIGAGSGSVALTGGNLHIEGGSGDLWNTADDILFYHRDVTGDFEVDSLVVEVASPGDAQGWCHHGGVLLRTSIAPEARNRFIGPIRSAVQHSTTFRLAEGGGSAPHNIDGNGSPLPYYARLRIIGSETWSYRSDNGLDWTEQGVVETLQGARPNTMVVGIPLASLDQKIISADVAWFRVRRATPTIPNVALGTEEVLAP
jgi:hypothetical protein